MFGKHEKPPEEAEPARVSAAERAKILGGGLVQVVVIRPQPLTYCLFVNDHYVDQADVGSLFVEIQGPTQDAPDGAVQATLEHQVKPADGGEAVTQRTELFPCTVEIVGFGRRLVIVAAHANSLEGLWMELGLKPDGTTFEIEGAQGLRVVLDDPVLSAQLTWPDGTEEDIFPQVSET